MKFREIKQGTIADYEDLGGQGLLLRLPCKIGDTVYVVPSWANYRLNIINGYPEFNKVYEQTYVRQTRKPHTWRIVDACRVKREQ